MAKPASSTRAPVSNEDEVIVEPTGNNRAPLEEPNQNLNEHTENPNSAPVVDLDDKVSQDDEYGESDLALLNLKLKGKHPNNAFRIGSITVTGYQYKQYALTEEECKELLTKGARAWIDCEEYNLDEEFAKL